MKSRALIACLLLVICGGLVVSGCKQETTGPERKPTADGPDKVALKLRVGYLPSMAAAQMYVAIHNGYFKDEQLEIELTEIYSAPEVIQALQARAIDIGFGVLPTVALARGKNIPVRALVGATTDSGKVREHRIIVSKDSTIGSIADLRGKSIALVAEPTSDGLSLFEYLGQHGLSKDDVTLIKTPHPEMIVAVSTGAVQAAAAIEPFITNGLQAGKIKVLSFYYPEGVTEVGTYIVNDDWLSSNSEPAARFTSAILKANKWINEDHTRLRSLLPQLHEHGVRFRISEQAARDVHLPGFHEYPTTGGVRELIRLLRKYDFLDSDVDPTLILPRKP